MVGGECTHNAVATVLRSARIPQRQPLQLCDEDLSADHTYSLHHRARPPGIPFHQSAIVLRFSTSTAVDTVITSSRDIIDIGRSHDLLVTPLAVTDHHRRRKRRKLTALQAEAKHAADPQQRRPGRAPGISET